VQGQTERVDLAALGEDQAVVRSGVNCHRPFSDAHLDWRRRPAGEDADAQLAVYVLSKGKNTSFLQEREREREGRREEL
jgi:hypothetical protein